MGCQILLMLYLSILLRQKFPNVCVAPELSSQHPGRALLGQLAPLQWQGLMAEGSGGRLCLCDYKNPSLEVLDL